MGVFSENYNNIKYPIESGSSPGLRNAQLGAIHAISANATLEPKGSSIIVMPTGSGKTTVLVMAPFVLKKAKVLVVTPSSLVRGQIASEFIDLHTLKHIGVLGENVSSPIVYEATHLYSNDQQTNIIHADVVVASHQVAASISDDDIRNQFDYVIIDEAHHVPANTWQRILRNMSHASSLLVTATPFRHDRKEIRGTQVYYYPLSRAYNDGVFGNLLFLPIEEAPNKDFLIAKEAERVFRNDRAEGFDHYLMVRTDTKEKAKELEKLYFENTGLKLRRIDSSMTFSSIKRTIKALKDGSLDGIVCVDMLGEGFDFPNLKIAAVHEPHKSLSSTLQFVGRFARTNGERIGDAKFIAMNDESLKIENERLYSSDAVWNDMIIELSEKKITKDIETISILNSFSHPDKVSFELSLNNIRVNCHAKVYHASDFDSEKMFPDMLSVDDYYRWKDNNTVIGISNTVEAPIWLDSGQALNNQVLLYIVHYQTKTNLLFIYSQIKTEIVYESIASNFCKSFSRISREKMNRVLSGYSDYAFFNTGMQNRFAESGESYRIYAGVNTAASIDETTGAMLSAGHAFCRVSQGEIDSTIGYSSGSKIWSSQYLSIPDYLSWCDNNGKKIVNRELIVHTNTNYDKLPIPTEIVNYREDILFCFLSEDVFSSSPFLVKKGEEKCLGLLIDTELRLVSVDNGQRIIFSVTNDGLTSRFFCDTQGHYSSFDDLFDCIDGKNRTKLSDYFNEHPLRFKASDDTVYYGNEVLRGSNELETYDSSNIVALDWPSDEVDIRKEVSEVGDKKKSVQSFFKNYLIEMENPYPDIIFFDHGSGEIADFITIQEDSLSINVGLFHCKAMKGANYNTNVSDVYEVAQQSVKCSIWVKDKSALLYKMLKRIEGHSSSSFIRGDRRMLSAILKKEKLLNVEVFVVQPAISKSITMEDKIGRILSAASFYLCHTGRVKKLIVYGSK